MGETSLELRGEPGHVVEAMDMRLAARAADQLNKHFPGYMWAVNVDSEGGVMVIKNYNVSFLYGYVLHLAEVNWDPMLRSVMRAGGEILERANLKVGKHNGDTSQYVDGLKPQHQPINGVVI